MIHPGLSNQMCDQEWIQRLGREARCSAVSAGVDPENSRTTDCLGPSVRTVELCLKLLWCRKIGPPFAELCMWLQKAHSVRNIQI